MLARLVVKNFKSIGGEGVDLELRPLTILVGPNGGGKSSIIEAIAFASQDLNVRGRLFQPPSLPEVVHKRQAEREIRVDTYSPDTAPYGCRNAFLSGKGSEFSFVETGGGAATSLPSQIQVALSRSHARLRDDTFLLSAVRGGVPPNQNTRVYPNWVGVHGESLLPLLSRIFASREYNEIGIKVVDWATGFGIDGLKAGFSGGDLVASDYQDDELEVALNLALSSSGARQILTVITQLFWAPAGSLIMIEEPEISLHPKAQVDIIELFGDVLAEGKQIIATTHSQFLLLALSNAVREKQLRPEQVCVYHVDKGKDGTSTKELEIDPNGYLKGWVPSFAKVERTLLRRWVETLPEE